jgi:hypothetical protein
LVFNHLPVQIFNKGTLSFPVKNSTDVDDIKGITLNLFTRTPLNNLTISLITNSKISYSLPFDLNPETSYQLTTHLHNYIYEESLVCLQKLPGCHRCEEPVYRIEVHKEDDEREIIISSITIIYSKHIITFYLISP